MTKRRIIGNDNVHVSVGVGIQDRKASDTTRDSRDGPMALAHALVIQTSCVVIFPTFEVKHPFVSLLCFHIIIPTMIDYHGVG